MITGTGVSLCKCIGEIVGKTQSIINNNTGWKLVVIFTLLPLHNTYFIEGCVGPRASVDMFATRKTPAKDLHSGQNIETTFVYVQMPYSLQEDCRFSKIRKE
jgi:hypothetical protein